VRWAAAMPADHAEACGDLRHVPEVAAACVDEVLWLRGPQLTRELQMVLFQVPNLRLYERDAEDRLYPPGRRVPCGELPAVTWSPLHEMLTLQVQTAALPGDRPEPLPLRLLRGGEETPAEVLVSSFGPWRSYIVNAPQVRLRPLRWALAQDGSAVLQGSPLPQLPGRRYCLHAERVAVPLGFTWDPPVDAEVLVRLFRLRDGDLALLAEDGSWHKVLAEDFRAATRASIRLSAKRLQAGS